jgi:hypothetical protein
MLLRDVGLTPGPVPGTNKKCRPVQTRNVVPRYKLKIMYQIQSSTLCFVPGYKTAKFDPYFTKCENLSYENMVIVYTYVQKLALL